ncbi:MAG: hypothetical protein H6550_07790 [Chitinophagales bacterium]|nr:hypothetical protein [Chitinophagales bacterium]
MKKFAPIAAVALLAIAFTSCKKDFTCECTDSNGTVTPYTYPKTTKALAKTSCDASNVTWTSAGGSCKLK